MWEEIYLSNRSTVKKNQPTDNQIEIPVRKKNLTLEDIELYKSKIQEQQKNKLFFHFEPAHFIIIKNNNTTEFFFEQSIQVKEMFIPLNHVLYDIFSDLSEKILSYFQSDFTNDPEILDILSNYLLFSGRLEEYKRLATEFLNRGCLPLHHHTFLICLGSLEDTIHESISNETGIIFTIYRFLFSEVRTTEKSAFYDALLTGTLNNLLFMGFLVFKDEQDSIRNVFPILSMLMKNTEELSVQEKDILISYYTQTDRYWETYFILKKEGRIDELQKWFQSLKNLYGKVNSSSQEVNLNRPEQLRAKFKKLKLENKLYTLQPFEILLLLNSTESFLIRDNVDLAYSNFPNSYIINRSKAAIHFFDNEFYSFFKHCNQSGRFQFQAEILYIKALALIELNHKTEANILLYALQKKFPNSNFLKNALEEFKI